MARLRLSSLHRAEPPCRCEQRWTVGAPGRAIMIALGTDTKWLNCTLPLAGGSFKRGRASPAVHQYHHHLPPRRARAAWAYHSTPPARTVPPEGRRRGVGRAVTECRRWPSRDLTMYCREPLASRCECACRHATTEVHQWSRPPFHAPFHARQH